MRLCGDFRGRKEVGGREERSEPHSVAPELLGAALLAIDDADGSPHRQPRRAEGLDRLEQRASGGHNVLDDADRFACCELALDALCGAVVLRRLADDQERQSRRERPRSGQRDRAELRAGEARRLGCVFACGGGDAYAECGKEVGPRLEAILVEVVARTAYGAEYEVALEVGVLAQGTLQLVVCHLSGCGGGSPARAESAARHPASRWSGRASIHPRSTRRRARGARHGSARTPTRRPCLRLSRGPSRRYGASGFFRGAGFFRAAGRFFGGAVSPCLAAGPRFGGVARGFCSI